MNAVTFCNSTDFKIDQLDIGVWNLIFPYNFIYMLYVRIKLVRFLNVWE